MRAAIYPGDGKPIIIETLPDPGPRPGDLLIEVARCGICGTDLVMTRGGAWQFPANGQFGHEYAGTVIGMGRDVAGFRIGDRITALPGSACGQCEPCRLHGNNVLCEGPRASAMVGFAELAKVPASVATRLPSTLSLTDGALVEPLAVGLYGVRFAHIQPGERVLVLGGGTVALYAIYWARRLGAGRIVAMSRSPRRQRLSLEMGADAFVTFGDNEVGEVVEALGGSPEVVLEGAGAEGMLARSVNHAARFGRIVSLGFCTAPDPLIPAMASSKCLSMQFVVGYTMREFQYIADRMDKGHVDPKGIVSNEIPLLDLPTMMDRLRGPNEETKVHVLMTG